MSTQIEIDKKLTAGKSTKNTQDRKGKSFGYQILGFGSGGGGPICITYDWFVVGGFKSSTAASICCAFVLSVA